MISGVAWLPQNAMPPATARPWALVRKEASVYAMSSHRAGVQTKVVGRIASAVAEKTLRRSLDLDGGVRMCRGECSGCRKDGCVDAARVVQQRSDEFLQDLLLRWTERRGCVGVGTEVGGPVVLGCQIHCRSACAFR